MCTCSFLKKETRITICCALLLLGTSAYAQESAEDDAGVSTHAQPSVQRIGAATSSALQMQVEGKQAGAALPMLGPAATLSYQRYLDSYKHPIPETFTRTLDEVRTR